MACFDLFADSLIRNGSLNSFRSQRKTMANKVLGFDLSSNKVLFDRINKQRNRLSSQKKGLPQSFLLFANPIKQHLISKALIQLKRNTFHLGFW